MGLWGALPAVGTKEGWPGAGVGGGGGLTEPLPPGHTVSQAPDDPASSYSSPHSGHEEAELRFTQQLA